MIDPYVVYGKIRKDGVLQSGASVTVRNDTRSQEAVLTTNAIGEYAVSLADATKGFTVAWQVGDTVKVTYNGIEKTHVIASGESGYEFLINLWEIAKDAVSKGTAQQAPETTFNVPKDAVSKSSLSALNFELQIFIDALSKCQSPILQELQFNLAKEAVGKASATPITNVDFNVTKDVIAKVLDSVAVEVVIAKDAITKVSAAESFESLLNLTKDAIAKSGAATVIQTQYNIPKQALATASASVIITTVSGLIEIFEDAVARASASSGTGIFDPAIFDPNIFDIAEAALKIETLFNVPEDAVVKVDASNLIQSTFNVAGDVIVKVLADAFVEALHLLVEIYKFANVTASADLATQATLNVMKDAAQKATTDLLLQSIFNQELSSSAKAMATVALILANWTAFKLITKGRTFEPLTVLGTGFSPLTIKSKSYTPLIITGE